MMAMKEKRRTRMIEDEKRSHQKKKRNIARQSRRPRSGPRHRFRSPIPRPAGGPRAGDRSWTSSCQTRPFWSADSATLLSSRPPETPSVCPSRPAVCAGETRPWLGGTWRVRLREFWARGARRGGAGGAAAAPCVGCCVLVACFALRENKEMAMREEGGRPKANDTEAAAAVAAGTTKGATRRAACLVLFLVAVN